MAPGNYDKRRAPGKTSDLEPKERREKLITAWGASILLLFSIFMFIYTYRTLRHPVIPPSFTRIGGDTRIETAVETARFWPPRPARTVVTRGDAKDATMLGAAAWAAAIDAPLLFIPASGKLPAALHGMLKEMASSVMSYQWSPQR